MPLNPVQSILLSWKTTTDGIINPSGVSADSNNGKSMHLCISVSHHVGITCGLYLLCGPGCLITINFFYR